MTITAAPTSEYPVTAHCRVSTEVPVSAEMAGKRMLTADVLAFTTSVEMQVTTSTAPAFVPFCATSLMPASFRSSARAWYASHRG